MASNCDENGIADQVTLVDAGVGRVTARHIEPGVIWFDDTEREALRELADDLDTHFGRNDAIRDLEVYPVEFGIAADIGSDGEPNRLE